jgi:hypothetical protein
MIWGDKWRSLEQWVDRLPFWQAIVLLPPLGPLVVVAAACLCPRTTAVAAFILLSVYAYLIRSGLIGWDSILPFVGRFCIASMGIVFLSVLQAHWEKALERWLGEKGPATKDKG